MAIVGMLVAAWFCLLCAQRASSLPTGCDSSDSICDPEEILLPKDKDSIQSSIHVFETRWIMCRGDRISIPLRVYIEGLDHNETANYTVESIRNEWGDGDCTECGRLGVFTYVRAKDGTMKVTRGKNLVVHSYPATCFARSTLRAFQCAGTTMSMCAFWSTLENPSNRSSEWYTTGLKMARFRSLRIGLTSLLIPALTLLCTIGFPSWLTWGFNFFLLRTCRVYDQLGRIDAQHKLFRSRNKYEPISCPMCLGRFRTEDSVHKLHRGHRKKLCCGHVFGGSCWDNVQDMPNLFGASRFSY